MKQTQRETWQALYLEEGSEQDVRTGPKRWRRKQTRAGKMLDVAIYPVWDTKADQRKAKAAISREAVQKINEENAKKKITHLLNENFDEKDLFLTLTYKKTPPGYEQARRDVKNFIARLRRYRDRQGLPELKYLYVIETGKYEDAFGNPKRIHIHMAMTGMDRDMVEKLWKMGYSNSRRLQPNEYGLEGLARYMTKGPEGRRRWAASRNLRQPATTYPKTPLTRRRVERIASDEEMAANMMRKLYPQYRLTDVKVKRSAFVTGAYIYARLRREEPYDQTGRTAHGGRGGADGGLPGRTAPGTRERSYDTARRKDKSAGSGDGPKI